MRRVMAVAIALAGCGRIGFDPAGGGGGGGGAGGDGGSSSGDGPIVTGSCANIVFSDAFQGMTTGGSWFPVVGGTGSCNIGVNVTTGNFAMSISGASDPSCHAGLRQNPYVDLHGTCAVFEIQTVPTSSTDRGIVAVGTDTDLVGFRIEVNLSAVSRTGGADTELASMPFDPQTQRFVLVAQTGTGFALGAAPVASGPFQTIASAPVGSVNLGSGGLVVEEMVVSGTGVVGDTFAVASVSLAR